jgi:SAM-dependent methyltransferase
MSSGTDQSPKKVKERESINNQLILECIGKANRDGVNLQGKVRSRTQDIPSKTMDVVMSTGAIARSGSGAVELVNEVYRMLRPGGLFVFCDSDGSSNVIEAIEKVFPATITSGQSAGEKSRKAKAMSKKMEESDQKRTKKRKATSAANMEATEAIEMGEEATNEDIVVDEEAPNVEQSGAVQTRPGISYERISNLFDPYVTGICVRP